MTHYEKLKALAATKQFNMWLNNMRHLNYWDVNIGVCRETHKDLDVALAKAVDWAWALAIEKGYINDHDSSQAKTDGLPQVQSDVHDVKGA